MTLKSKVDKLSIGNYETTPDNLSNLSDVVYNEVVKKTEYKELVKKVNAIQTTGSSNLVKETDYNAKMENNLNHKLPII